MRFFVIGMIIFISLCFFAKTSYAHMTQNVSARQAIVMEMQSGRVLFEKNSHEQTAIASITKIMTALIALEYGNMHDKVKVSRQAASAEGSSLYLEEDDLLTLEDLLYGLMLRSGNDAAIAIAEHVGGSSEGFVYLMNEQAKMLGMEQTSFANPHGLDADNHYSTAYDMALLMTAAMENNQFRKIASTKTYEPAGKKYQWFNKHKLITHLYSYTTGGKTGYTQKAGRTLVTTAEKNNLQLVAVTLDAANDWQDHIALFTNSFAAYETVLLERKGKKQYEIDKQQYEGLLKENILYPVTSEEKTRMKKKVVLYRQPLGRTIGEIQFILDGRQIMITPLYHILVGANMNSFMQELQENG